MAKKDNKRKLTGYNWFQILTPIVIFAVAGFSLESIGALSKGGIILAFFIGCVVSKVEYIIIVNNLKDITILKYRK